MAEQWIEASRALELAGSSHALCERASVDLVKARAQLLLIDNDRHEEAVIPPKFWWAKGHEALVQDWTSGDFSTWIDHSEERKAFGVTFAFSGLLEMLPFERRGQTARSYSVAGNADWISASEARKFAYNEAGLNPTRADRVVIEQGQLGFLTARAVLAQGSTGGSNEKIAWSWEAREWDIPPWFWNGFTDAGSSSQDWTLGIFAGRGKGPNDLRYFTLHGVHFLRESLGVLIPGTIATSAKSEPKNKGGRPPAAFADDLMCAIWGLIYQGDLKPRNQAEIARAMLDWAAANDQELGATLAREKAQKVFAALKTDIGNPSQ